jgi:hypothetical protein
MKAKRKTKAPLQATKHKGSEPDDFVSVARRLGTDESKERFEKRLAKIANVKKSKS